MTANSNNIPTISRGDYYKRKWHVPGGLTIITDRAFNEVKDGYKGKFMVYCSVNQVIEDETGFQRRSDMGLDGRRYFSPGRAMLQRVVLHEKIRYFDTRRDADAHALELYQEFTKSPPQVSL